VANVRQRPDEAAGWPYDLIGSEQSPQPSEFAMVICPVALAVGCRKCPIFSFCPVKGVIGDYKEGAAAAAKKPGAKPKAGARGK